MTRAVFLSFLLVGLVLAQPAAAFYGNGAQIVSADFGRLEQGDDASQFAAMAAGGRYVAIQTRARNFFADDDPDPPGQFRAGGIFRFDLATRGLDLVADGDFKDEAGAQPLVVRGAQSPSISADGRYVAFSTGQALVPADVNGSVDVYVRDMDVPIRTPGAFDLVSARDGTNTPATYGPHTPDLPGRNTGADLTRGVAISADGSRVLFRTVDPSDLPAQSAADTPGGQLFLRDRSADSTTLVTRTSATGDPAGGAVGPAAISADGTTAAWTGSNAPAQTRFIDGENTDPGFYYYLWRRIADGPGAQTRRITGVADPDDPGCPPGSSAVFNLTATGPCLGPLTIPELGATNFSLAPALSGDGLTVAFLTGAGPRPDVTTGGGLDLYLTHMDPGLTRKSATIELTRDGQLSDPEASPPIDSVAMSADGRWLALGTARTRFLHPALSEVGARRVIPGTRDLYAVDLVARTIERVTRGVDGSDANGGVVSEPSMSADGSRIAFTTFASNLLFGDANERADAFVAERQPEPQGTSQDGGGGSTQGDADVTEDLGGDSVPLPTSVRNLGRGRLELRVRVPAPGTLTAVARGTVKAGRRKARRVLARATQFSPRAARVTITLAVVRRYRSQVRRKGRLAARVGLTFSPSRGGRKVSRTIRVTFTQKGPHKPKRPKKHRKSHSSGERLGKNW